MSPRGTEPGSWGPIVAGGRRLRWLRMTLVVLGSVVALGAVALASAGFLIYNQAERNISRVTLPELSDRDPTAAQHFLIVGSDSRDELTREERNEFGLGHDVGGSRSDTIIVVSILPNRSGVSVVSFPRDLYVVDDGADLKLTETFNDGPNNLIQVLRDNFGIPINHYVEVSVQGFVEVVRTVGAVEICLEEELRDPKADADFAAGCTSMQPTEALSYVRSRVGSDFRRIERQQTFMRAMIDEMISADMLTDVPRLSQVVRDVAGNVATDPGLGTGDMVSLARELRQLARGDIPMTTVPAYDQRIDGKAFVVAYEPGTRPLIEAIREGEPLEPRGTDEQRAETSVAVWSGGRDGAQSIVLNTLDYAGFPNRYPAGVGEESADAGATTIVYEVPGHEQEAGWVAAVLGADVEPLPAGVDPPEDTDVVVGAGDDAMPPA